MPIQYFLLSLASSIIAAISGIGGGIIIRSVLDTTHSLSISAISFLSACTLLAMSSVSVIRNAKNNKALDIKMSTLLGVGAVVGGILGKYIFNEALAYFPAENNVGAIQSACMFLITAFVFFYFQIKHRIHAKKIKNPIFIIFIGIALGMISAFLGIGGGPLNVAVLYYFFSMAGKTAALNSLYIIMISQIASLLTMLTGHTIPVYDPRILLFMIVGGVSGALIGYRLNQKLQNEHVEKVFCFVVLCTALINIWNFYRYLV